MKMWRIQLLLFCAAFTCVIAGDDLQERILPSPPKTYEGYKVYKLNITTEADLEFLKRYDGRQDFEVLQRAKNSMSKIIVPPELQKAFEKELGATHIPYIVDSTISGVIKEETKEQIKSRILEARSFNEDYVYNFQYYPNYDEIVEFLNYLTKNRSHSKVITIGQSYEKRPIYAIEIIRDPENPVFLVDAGIHAREWTANVVALFIAKKITEIEEKMTSDLNFVIIPCVNPDGYEFSMMHNRLWRKTRSRIENSVCMGVDINRNFDAHWGEYRSDRSDCSPAYGGRHPFSEPESRALRDTMIKYKPFAYLTLHSYGALLLYPWSYKDELPPNWRVLSNIAKKVASVIKKVGGPDYTVGSATQILYRASGSSDDWALEKGNVSIVYSMELPQYKESGFVMPSRLIDRLNHETYAGFLTMVENIVTAYDENLV